MAAGDRAAIFFSGFLTKRPVRAVAREDWKRRWFILDGSSLSYAKRAGGTPIFTLKLSATSRVRIVNAHRENELEVFCDGNGKGGGSLTLYAAADNESDADLWVHHIQRAIDALRGVPATAASGSGGAAGNRAGEALSLSESAAVASILEMVAAAEARSRVERGHLYACIAEAEVERIAAVRAKRRATRPDLLAAPAPLSSRSRSMVGMVQLPKGPTAAASSASLSGAAAGGSSGTSGRWSGGSGGGPTVVDSPSATTTGTGTWRSRLLSSLSSAVLPRVSSSSSTGTPSSMRAAALSTGSVSSGFGGDAGVAGTDAGGGPGGGAGLDGDDGAAGDGAAALGGGFTTSRAAGSSAGGGGVFTGTVLGASGLYAWGSGDAGQMADGRVLPDGVSRPSRVDALSASSSSSSSSAASGSGVGVGGAAARNVPLAISAGTCHAAAITADNRLMTWGDAASGATGHASDKNGVVAVPTPVAGLAAHRVLAVACGAAHTLCTTEGGALWAWGTGKEGQLGLGPAITSQRTPRRVESIPTAASVSGGHPTPVCFAAVAAGRFSSAGITDTGAVYSWGSNEHGRIGHGPPPAQASGGGGAAAAAAAPPIAWSPTRVLALATTACRAVALGDNFSAFVVGDGELRVAGALGLTREQLAARPDLHCWPHTTITFGTRPIVTKIAAGRSHLAIIADHSLYMAGRGWLGCSTLQLAYAADAHAADDEEEADEVEAEVVAASGAAAWDAGASGGTPGPHTGGSGGGGSSHRALQLAALRRRIARQCQAAEALAAVGSEMAPEPLPVPDLDCEGVCDAAAGVLHTVVRTRDGRLFGFGCNTTGALGAGHVTSCPRPVPLIGLEHEHYIAVACGADFTLGLVAVGAPPQQVIMPEGLASGSGGRGSGYGGRGLFASAARQPDEVPSGVGRLLATATASIPSAAAAAFAAAATASGGIVGGGSAATDDAGSVGEDAEAVGEEEEEGDGGGDGTPASPVEGDDDATARRIASPVSSVVQPLPDDHLPVTDGAAPSDPAASRVLHSAGAAAAIAQARPPPAQALAGDAVFGVGSPAAAAAPPPTADAAVATPPIAVAPPAAAVHAAPATGASAGTSGGGAAPSGAEVLRAARRASKALARASMAPGTLGGGARASAVHHPHAQLHGGGGGLLSAADAAHLLAGGATGVVAEEDDGNGGGDDDMVLPPGWERWLDAEGDAYFHHPASGASTWLLFWQLRDEDTGDAYFVDCETRQTQWEKPEDGAVIISAE